ncbi:MAG: nucleotidyltransferase [Coriobacteriia bacterium]|nr:nucleotidyltransferase [Coriobacteriia bacterium]
MAVSWDASSRTPAAFAWRGRLYDVASVVQTWAVEHSWWDAGVRVSQRCWRVVVKSGGTYDLAFDRLTGAWLLLGIQD